MFSPICEYCSDNLEYFVFKYCQYMTSGYCTQHSQGSFRAQTNKLKKANTLLERSLVSTLVVFYVIWQFLFISVCFSVDFCDRRVVSF